MLQSTKMKTIIGGKGAKKEFVRAVRTEEEKGGEIKMKRVREVGR